MLVGTLYGQCQILAKFLGASPFYLFCIITRACTHTKHVRAYNSEQPHAHLKTHKHESEAMNILIIVDMQNDFVTGALGTSQAHAIVANVKEKAAACLERGDIVIFTRDTHHANYLSTLEGKNLPVTHCIQGSEGWQIIDELLPLAHQATAVIDKPTFGSFELLDVLAPFVESGQIETIELCGVCTDICVVSNALLVRAKFHETPLVVDSACCAGVTPESHESALQVLRSCHVRVL